MFRKSLVAVAFVFLWASLSCAEAGSGVDSLAAGDTLSLPEVKVFGTVSVEEVLSARRSVREFKEEDVTLAQVAQLFWPAQGVTDTSEKRRFRTAPSAGSLYPLQVYAVWNGSVWQYLPKTHTAVLKTKDITRFDLAKGCRSPAVIQSAPVCFIITGNYSHTGRIYEDRGERYVNIEVGHAAQNLLLQAVALGLGSVPVGSVKEAELKTLMGLPEEETPLYILPVGVKKTK